MKKLFLMGRSEAGKTSLTQILSGEELHYHKTQYTNTGTDIIDSPGEYSETKRCGLGLACFSFEADVLALLMAADEPFSVLKPTASASPTGRSSASSRRLTPPTPTCPWCATGWSTPAVSGFSR